MRRRCLKLQVSGEKFPEDFGFSAPPTGPDTALRAHAEVDYDEATAFGNYFNPEAGHRIGPGGATGA